MISINPTGRHLLVATTRICALLVLLISSPLLYFTSAPVVASIIVTILSTVASIGLLNKQSPTPPLPFNPSPPVVPHIINSTVFPPKYKSRHYMFRKRPLRSNKKYKPDPIMFAIIYCISQCSCYLKKLHRALPPLLPPHPLLHCLIYYTTTQCLHVNADHKALTDTFIVGLSTFTTLLRILRRRLSLVERRLREWIFRGLSISVITYMITWLTNMPPAAPHGLILLLTAPPRKRYTALFIISLLCLPAAAAAPPAWLDPLDQASSIITSFITSATSQREHTERPIDTSPSHTVHGTSDTADTDFKAMTLNIRGGISQAHKWGMICELTATHNPDLLTLCETGYDNSPDKLQWLTRRLYPTHHLSQDNISHKHSDALPYLIFSSDGSHQGERGGVVTLLHKRWLHRRVGKPVYDQHKRWHAFDIRTPLGRTTIISAYMKPDPTSQLALTEWDELIDFVASRHLKKRRVILLGDLNVCLNTPLTRSKPRDTCIQHEILLRLMEYGGLVDAFPHRHPDKKYSTYTRSTTTGDILSWSSLDHIMVSVPDAQHIREISISDAPTVDFALDHSLLTLHLDVSTVAFSPPAFKRPSFDTDRAADYAQRIALNLSTLTKGDTSTEIAHQLFSNCIQTAEDMFSNPNKRAPKSRPYVLKSWNDLKAINVALHHLRSNTPIPAHISCRKTLQGYEDIPSLLNLKATIRSQLNSKSRKQAHVTRRLFTNRRSSFFAAGKLGAFLTSALNRTSTFRGIEGVIDEHSGAVTRDPATTKALATRRISTTFFKPRIPAPAHTTNPTTANWLAQPQWFRNTFHTSLNPATNPIFDDVLRPATTLDLQTALRHLGRNKAGGPSGLTTEMLVHLDTRTQEEWLLPFLNACIREKDIPSRIKRFNVWCIEKEQGVGPIMHPTSKLQVRPISLFEVSLKLVEAVIATRIHNTMTKHSHMHPSQHGFLPQRSVTDALLTYTLLMEDAHDHKKEIHISNNDCTQAYDAVPPWAMRAIYRYHGFPPQLVEMLCNMDTKRVGRVLTAHGAGTEWDMTCGLGQGSVLAPLKWNLFLDPLLKRMDSTRDPYTFTSQSGTHDIRVAAFADDTTIIASTHDGYVERMNMAIEYFSHFGVNFSPSKTHYTYAHTHGRHYNSVEIPVRNPDGTTSITPSSVTPPHTPLRYLGGWLSPTGNWQPAKQKLQNEVQRILTILKHKQLTISQFQYTIRSVLHAKLRYLLLVVPMTDKELDNIDNDIASVFKARMKLARSSSSPLLFMSHDGVGAGLPSVRDMRDTLLVETAHHILNSKQHTLHHFAHSRLTSLRDSMGWTHSPLAKPSAIPSHHYHHNWMARAAHAMGQHDLTMEDTSNQHTRTGGRYTDQPLADSLPPHILTHLTRRNIHWVGQLATPDGRRIIRPTSIGINPNISTWWPQVLELLCSHNTNDLIHPVSPKRSPLPSLPSTHAPGSFVTMPDMIRPGVIRGHKHNRFFVVKSTSTGSDGREDCTLNELFPNRDPLWRVRVNGKRSFVQSSKGRTYRLEHTPTPVVEFANSLTTVPGQWIDTITEHDHTDHALFHDTTIIHTARGTLRGAVTKHMLKSTIINMHTKFKHTEEGYQTDDTTTSNTHHCHICGNHGATRPCSNRTCTHTAHDACCSTDWTCQDCLPSPTYPVLPPIVREALLSSPLTYTASDGSVRNQDTPHSSSTFGFHISHITHPFTHQGHIPVLHFEASSLRAELEGIITAYRLIPAEANVIHAVDNETAILLHDIILHRGLTDHYLAKQPYRATLVRLSHAIATRGASLPIEHTHSHLEHTFTPDESLEQRRLALAAADAAADIAHTLPTLPFDTTGLELFPLSTPDGTLEKLAGPYLGLCHELRWRARLHARRMEGAIHRSTPIPRWKTGSRSWPDHLRIFRHKLITNRLPTAAERHSRGDREDGLPVSSTCPTCDQHGSHITETQTHVLDSCPHIQHRHTIISRSINNTFRQFTQPAPLHKHDTDPYDQLLRVIDIEELDGWESITTDKHGRSRTIAKGEPLYSVLGKQFSHPWFRHIFHIHNTPWTSWTSVFRDHNPTDCIDPFLLSSIAHTTNASQVLTAIPSNPFITCNTPELLAAHNPLPAVISLTHTHISPEAERRLRLQLPTVLIIPTVDGAALRLQYPHLQRVLDIPHDQLAVWPRSFWNGRTGVMDISHPEELQVLATPHFDSSQIQNIHNIVYARCKSTPPPPTPMRTRGPRHTMQETPRNLVTAMMAPPSNPIRRALLHGLMDTTLTQDWDKVPITLHQKLYRKLLLDLTTHHHRTWLNRNAIAHPNLEHSPQAKSITRPRKHTPRTPPQPTPTLKRKTRSWNTQRSAQLKRRTMWRTGIPIPSVSPPWVRLCRLAQHSTAAIRRKRKRAQARDIQRLEDSAPPQRPRLTTWRRRKKQKQPQPSHQLQPVELDSTQISPAAPRPDDTRGGVVNLPDMRDRSGRGGTGPGESKGRDERGGSRAHRGGGGWSPRDGRSPE